MSIFHERLRALRDRKGDTQAKIAEGIGITPQALSYYFNNREPNFDTLCKIAKYFDVSTDYLLGLSGCEKLENESFFKETGLSEESIMILRELVCDGYFNADAANKLRIINCILQDEYFLSDLSQNAAAYEYLNNHRVTDSAQELPVELLEEVSQYLSDGAEIISPFDAQQLKLFNRQSLVIDFIKRLKWVRE